MLCNNNASNFAASQVGGDNGALWDRSSRSLIVASSRTSSAGRAAVLSIKFSKCIWLLMADPC